MIGLDAATRIGGMKRVLAVALAATLLLPSTARAADPRYSLTLSA